MMPLSRIVAETLDPLWWYRGPNQWEIQSDISDPPRFWGRPKSRLWLGMAPVAGLYMISRESGVSG